MSDPELDQSLRRERLAQTLKTAIPRKDLVDHWIILGWSDDFIAHQLNVNVQRVSTYRLRQEAKTQAYAARGNDR